MRLLVAEDVNFIVIDNYQQLFSPK